MNVFELARMRRIPLLALYLDLYVHRGGSDLPARCVAEMSNEQLVAGILSAQESRSKP